MPELHLATEEIAAYWTGRSASTIRRWAAEGRITRHQDRGRRGNGVLYDLWELPAAKRDEDGTLKEQAETPPVKDMPRAAAA